MSYQVIQKIPVTPNTPRDFFQSYALAANKKVDLLQEYVAMGLDIFIHNRGAASLTVIIDGQPAITIEAGDSFTWDNIKYAFISVISAVAYDMVLAGIHLSKKVLDRYSDRGAAARAVGI